MQGTGIVGRNRRRQIEDSEEEQFDGRESGRLVKLPHEGRTIL